MTLKIKIQNSWEIDLVRHVQHPYDAKRYYDSIVVARVFSGAQPMHLQGPLEIHFVDNHFSNIDNLNYQQLHNTLSKFFNPVVFLSDNPYDQILAPDYFKFQVDSELLNYSTKFITDSVKQCHPFEFHNDMMMFGLHILRPDVHRLAILVQLDRENLLPITDCRLGFDRAPLMADERWRSSGIDLCCKMMQISHLEVLDLIDRMPKSDRSFLNKGQDIRSSTAHQMDLEKNNLNKNFLVEIVCQSSVGNNVSVDNEKICRCIITGQPFILLGNNHAYQNMRKFGIRTYDSIWNEDWDELEFEQLQTKITKIGAVCKQLAQDYTVEELFLKTKEIRDHNYNVVQNNVIQGHIDKEFITKVFGLPINQ
jgi:hypothetical protein